MTTKGLRRKAASKSATPKVLTYCDFNTPGRRTVIGRHYSFETAARQYKRLWNTYHRLNGWKVWQEEVK